MGQINNMMTDKERWQLNKWLEGIGADTAWKLTAPQLAERYTKETGKRATAFNLNHCRTVVFPREARSGATSKLNDLERRIEALENFLVDKHTA